MTIGAAMPAVAVTAVNHALSASAGDRRDGPGAAHEQPAIAVVCYLAVPVLDIVEPLWHIRIRIWRLASRDEMPTRSRQHQDPLPPG
jgi:hypothetical protein